MAEYVKGVGRADDDEEAAKVRVSLTAYHATFADLRTTCCLQGPCTWHGRRMVSPHYQCSLSPCPLMGCAKSWVTVWGE